MLGVFAVGDVLYNQVPVAVIAVVDVVKALIVVDCYLYLSSQPHTPGVLGRRHTPSGMFE
ncbi:MAG: hypothetical protein RLZZ387_503 [Chloroflexota bacterium]